MKLLLVSANCQEPVTFQCRVGYLVKNFVLLLAVQSSSEHIDVLL